MAKCRLLYQENEELGKVISNGRLAKLETELAIQKNMNEELKKSHWEFEGIIQDLDQDAEGLTTTIISLQQKLKTAEDKIAKLEKESKEKPENDNNESIGDDAPAAKRQCVET